MQLIHANHYRDATMYTILSSGAHDPELATPILGNFTDQLFLASFLQYVYIESGGTVQYVFTSIVGK